MGNIALLLTAWLGSNVLFVLAVWQHTRKRHRAAQRAANARQRAARESSTSHVRLAARTGNPFPIAELRRNWRYDDERNRAHYTRKLRTTVSRLLAEDTPRGVWHPHHEHAPHARPGQPMATPYDWAQAPEPAGVSHV